MATDWEREQSKLTATRLNRMTPEEIRAFLDEPQEARLGTFREDGYIHMTPVWFVYEDGKVSFTLGESRRHLANLRRVPRATVLFDRDMRIGGSLDAGAKAVMLAGPVEIRQDTNEALALEERMSRHYLDDEAADAGAYDQGVMLEPRYLCVLTPEIRKSWDFTKV